MLDVSVYFLSIAGGKTNEEDQKQEIEVIIKSFVEKIQEKNANYCRTRMDLYRWIYIFIVSCCRFLAAGICHRSSLEHKHKFILNKISKQGGKVP